MRGTEWTSRKFSITSLFECSRMNRPQISFPLCRIIKHSLVIPNEINKFYYIRRVGLGRLKIRQKHAGRIEQMVRHRLMVNRHYEFTAKWNRNWILCDARIGQFHRQHTHILFCSCWRWWLHATAHNRANRLRVSKFRHFDFPTAV